MRNNMLYAGVGISLSNNAHGVSTPERIAIENFHMFAANRGVANRRTVPCSIPRQGVVML
jgi:hypothetical protein